MFNPFKKKVLICTWRDAYLNECLIRNVNSTYEAKKVVFRLLEKDFRENDAVTSITVSRVLTFLTKISIDRSGESANRARKRLAAAWSWGIKILDLPEKNPFRGIPKFRSDEQPRYVPSLEDFKAVHTLTRGADYAMLLTALHTAARRGEIFRLTWNDVDFNRRIIRFGTRKRFGGGLQYDWIPMTTQLKNTLLEHRKESIKANLPLIFPRSDGKEYIVRANFLRCLCAQAGVKRFGFHGIRHLAASIMADKGMSIAGVQMVLRHTSPLTTARYLHKLGVLANDLDNVFEEPP
jgi:integrase